MMHSRRITPAVCLLLLLSVFTASADAAPSPSLSSFEDKVRPILVKHCVGCHGRDKPKAKLRLDTLNPDLVKGPHAETWHDVLDNLNLGEMPPPDELALSDQDRRVLVGWLTGELKRAADAKRATGGKVVLRRLTRYEYQNTMRDLLGIDLDYAKNLPPEPRSKDGFKNNGHALGISPLQMEYYLAAARYAMSKAIVTGEAPKVHRHSSEKSLPPRKPYSPARNGRVEPGDGFMIKALNHPREGLVRIRVVARALATEAAGHPRMSVNIGHRFDVHSAEVFVKQVDLKPSEDWQTFEFVTRIENAPLPGHNPKYPGMLITVTNAFDPGFDIKPMKARRAKALKQLERRKRDLAKGKKVNDTRPIEVPELPVMPAFEVKSVSFEGPIYESWPPAHHTRILFADKQNRSEEDYAKTVLERFMSRAYRRPARADEVAAVLDFYRSIRPQSPTFEEAMREALAMVLVSPPFLFLVEPAPDKEQVGNDKAGHRSAGNERATRLSDHELASRLSYFLWSTMPDTELRALADAGKLSQPAELTRQVWRMIKDPRSDAFVQNFASQWLDLPGLERVAVNPEYYPDFDDNLKSHMRGETLAFFREVLQKNLSAGTLLDADFVMLNAPLAAHYGLTGPNAPRGMAFERFQLDRDNPVHRQRGGLLTQASVLLINSTGEDSHPIRRAVWLRDRLLDDPPAPPPPDVPDLDTEDPDVASLPLKQQLELHRKKASCNDCHARIDPWGIPFEHYDAIGLWRESVRRQPAKRSKRKVETPVVASTRLPSGHAVDGMDALKRYLLSHQRERFARALVRKMMAYGLGRSLAFGDQAQVDALVRGFEEDELRLGGLVVAIVRSDAFMSK